MEDLYSIDRLAERDELHEMVRRARHETSFCKACSGIGLVSRHAQDGSRDDSPCPECGPLTHEGLVRQFRALLAD